jgi:hypothetical protein
VQKTPTNIELDMNFGTLNQFKLKLEIEKNSNSIRHNGPKLALELGSLGKNGILSLVQQ